MSQVPNPKNKIEVMATLCYSQKYIILFLQRTTVLIDSLNFVLVNWLLNINNSLILEN